MPWGLWVGGTITKSAPLRASQPRRGVSQRVRCLGVGGGSFRGLYSMVMGVQACPEIASPQTLPLHGRPPAMLQDTGPSMRVCPQHSLPSDLSAT